MCVLMSKRTKIKVANVIMEGRFGGPQARITAVAEKLKNDGIETIVVFPKTNSKLFYNKLTERNIQTRLLGLHRLTKQKSHLIKYVIFFIPELLSLYKRFKKERVDIVHCNGSWQIKGVIAGRLAGIKVAWHLNDTAMPTFINIVFNFLALHFCDAFITAGERVREYYLSDKKLSKKPIVEIQAPVNTSVFDPKKVKEERKVAAYQGLKIVTVGNINPLKGIEYFVEMVSILNQQYNNLNFFVIGPHFDSQTQYSKKLSGLAKSLKTENLHFYGTSDNIPSILKAADIYVCSSIAEASPISVWEAMSMEKAIVSTDVGDVANFIKDGESGYVAPIKNASAMAEKIGLLIENTDLRKKVGINARKIAIRHLDIDICVKKHAEFYKKIMDEF